jgi:hypothetical protein
MLPSSPFPRNSAIVGTIQLLFHLFLVSCWSVFCLGFLKVVGVALSIFQMLQEKPASVGMMNSCITRFPVTARSTPAIVGIGNWK